MFIPESRVSITLMLPLSRQLISSRSHVTLKVWEKLSSRHYYTTANFACDCLCAVDGAAYSAHGNFTLAISWTCPNLKLHSKFFLLWLWLVRKSRFAWDDLLLLNPLQCTELGFNSFSSSGFTIASVVNWPDGKLANSNSVQWWQFSIWPQKLLVWNGIQHYQHIGVKWKSNKLLRVESDFC